LNDVSEGGRDEAGASDQGAVDFFLLHERGDVLRLDRASVEDAGVVGSLLTAAVGELMSDERMCLGSDLW